MGFAARRLRRQTHGACPADPRWVLIPPKNNGEGGIRTHGTFRYTGFRDRHDQPLCHLSTPKLKLYYTSTYIQLKHLLPMGTIWLRQPHESLQYFPWTKHSSSVARNKLMATSKRERRKKLSKPYPSFPLTAHNNGQWCKKICGKVCFFGVWDDPKEALERYLREAADLHAARQPSVATLPSDMATVKDVCNHYLTYQLERAESGEISFRWFEDTRSTIQDFGRYVSSGQPVSNLMPDNFRR